MKKLFLVLSVAGIFALSSCKKCYECSYSGSDSEELCEDDYPGGKAAMNSYIDALEASGWDCSKK